MFIDGHDKVLTRIIDSGTDQDAVARMAAFTQSTHFCHYKQSPEWFQACDKSTYLLIASFCNEQLVCSSVVRRRSIPFLNQAKYYIERGPIFLDPSYLDAHLTQLLILLEPTMLSLILNPYYSGADRELVLNILATLGFNRTPIGGQYQRTLVISLENTTEELYSNLSTKLRRHLKKSKSIGLKCDVLIDKKQRQSFYNHYEVFRLNNPGAGILPYTELDSLYDPSSHRPSCLMVTSNLGTDIVGGVLIFITGERAIYEFGFRTLNAMKHGLPGLHLPLWFAIKQCRKMGVKYFDMGGYAPDKLEYKSISRFKRYFGGVEQMVIGEYQYIPNTLTAKLIDLTAQVKYS